MAPTQPQPQPQPSDPSTYSFHGRGRGRGSWNKRGGRGRGSGRPQQHSYTEHQQGYPNWAWWTPPPCPYPTQQPWRPHNTQPTTSPQHAHYVAPSDYPPRFTQPPSPGYNALCPSDLSAAFTNMQVNHPSFSWHMDIMDTGAASHLTQEPSKIVFPNSSLVHGNILVGNGSYLPILGSGTGLHSLPNRTYILSNVLYNPQIIKNLIHVRRFTRDNNVSIEFDPLGFSLKDLDVCKLPRNLSRYARDLATRQNNRVKPQSLSEGILVIFLCRIPRQGFRWASRYAKGSRNQFFLSLASDLKTKKTLSRHNSTRDLYPFTPPQLPPQASYLTTASFPWHDRLCHPGAQTLDVLGGEFDNHAFKSFADHHGLLFRFSCPQTSPQNGRVERMIRRLNDVICALPIHANIPPTFWVESLHIASYLHNILPTKRLTFYTPTFALYLRHPEYDHLWVFGGYRCFDPTTGKVHTSRHVTFDENTFPYTIPQTSSSYTFLDDPLLQGFTFQGPVPRPPVTITYPRRPRPPPIPPLTNATQPSNPVLNSPPQPPSRPSQHMPANSHPMTTRFIVII
ncbi:hypothetical protein E3N88_15794 [Mikania micrantha]|uniref:Integrase catalytic domain-containing protein n=1 Tax=Mikania micrantha TaxID=192012 RepID=A0A5N6NWL8_9ASTR|nr:hypothetical protein E3N88_15794 [Mikania micrantha]